MKLTTYDLRLTTYDLRLSSTERRWMHETNNISRLRSSSRSTHLKNVRSVVMYVLAGPRNEVWPGRLQEYGWDSCSASPRGSHVMRTYITTGRTFSGALSATKTQLRIPLMALFQSTGAVPLRKQLYLSADSEVCTHIGTDRV